MSIRDVAQAFADLLKAGKHREAGEQFWAEDVVSREAMEGPMGEIRGKDAVRGKSEWWYASHEVHSTSAEGPFVHGDQFAMRFEVDVTVKETGQRVQMAEIGLYTVAGGKVVEERFFY